ncbi:MAG: hypothetical protein FJZ01_08825 [Candidatus Sericytochromatia bacterium]|nr:hypothetical protein [Candidatus Tanganyikabacteria bacterium]
MNRWHELIKVLRKDGRPRIVLSVSQIEEILGRELPASYKYGRWHDWWARQTFPRTCGYRGSVYGVPEGHVAFVRIVKGVAEAAGRTTGRPSVWDRLLAVLARHRGKDVVFSLAEIEKLRGVPTGSLEIARVRKWFSGRDKPWTGLGFRVSWVDTPPDHVRFTPIRPRTGTNPRVRKRARSSRPASVWEPFLRHLAEQVAPSLLLSFEDIGRLRGRPLPSSALKHRSVWFSTRQPWVALGWRADFQGVPPGHVRFYRPDSVSPDPPAALDPQAAAKAATVRARRTERRAARRAADPRPDGRSVRPSKWDPVVSHLMSLKVDRAVLAVAFIERLICQKLPGRAYTGIGYWCNQRKPWVRAGWRTVHDRATRGNVEFFRAEDAAGTKRPPRESPWKPLLERLARRQKPLVLTYGELERLVGWPLPPSARSTAGYWAHPGKPWVALGWRVSRKGIPSDAVRFVKALSLAPDPKDWDKLVAFLRKAGGERVELSMSQVAEIFGAALPDSAFHRPSYWQNTRRPWYAAGFAATFDGVPDGHVAFQPRRQGAGPGGPKTSGTGSRPDRRRSRKSIPIPGREAPAATPAPEIASIIVQGSGLTARNPLPARDFFVSPEFRERRQIAEATGLRWFILDDLMGLVPPDRRLARRPAGRPTLFGSTRGTWRAALIQGLLREFGSIGGLTFAVLAEEPVAAIVADLLVARDAVAVDGAELWQSRR